MPVMNMFPGGSTLQIPLDAPTSFAATAGNAQVELTWTDPANKYATPEGEVSETGDQLVSEWSHTVLVRKTGSQPAGPDDGTVVVSSSVRNQYQSTPYTDTGLTNDTQYFYGVFAYNKDGVASAGAFTSATPKAGTPLSELTEGTIIKINENGSPVEFYLAKHSYEPTLNGEGRELVVRKDCYDERPWNTANVNTWASCSIRSRLNGAYKGLLSSWLQEAIGNTTYYYTPGNGNSNVSTRSDAVFLLSVTELGLSAHWANEEGTSLPIASGLRIAKYNGNAIMWWLRSPDTEANDVVANVNRLGGVNGNACDNYFYSRPCFTLPSTATVTEELELVES